MLKIAIAIPLLLLTALAQGQTSLQIRPAWGDKDRAWRWNPVLVRVSDPVPRNVTLQLISPEPGGFQRVLEEHIAVGPIPATFELLVPVHASTWQQTIAVLRDGTTGKLMAQYPTVVRRSSPNVPAVGPHALFVGMTGTAARLDQLGNSLNADFGYLPEHQLPRSPLGYDSLDFLLLNRPRMVSLDLDQQQAILDWVRAGGCVLLTPGDDANATGSPLGTAMPCRFGDLRQLDLPTQTLADLHLSARFAHVAVRNLEPSSGAEALRLFNNSITGYSRRLGLGQIVVIPFDIRTIEADDPADRPAVVALWQPIVAALVRLPKPPTDTPRYAAPYNGFMSESVDQFREGAATATAGDFLIRPPLNSPRQWPHVTLMLLGMFVIVGPLDAFFLKLSGQSPWKWTTMVGWIACAVLAVLYSSSLMTQPPAAFATLRLIDQSDDASIATTDLIAVRLGGSKQAEIEQSPPLAPPGWWEPALPGSIGDPGLLAPQSDMSFHLYDGGCEPLGVTQSVERPRFFRRQNVGPTAPAISASLKLTGNGPTARITGTIQNLLTVPLKDLRLRTALGIVPVPLDSAGVLAPGQKITVDLAATGEAFAPSKYEGRYQNFGDWGSRSDAAPVREQDLWAVVPDLAARRSLKIDGLFESNAPIACLYAQSVGPAPTAKPAEAGNATLQSYEWLRAVIPLAREPI